MAQFNLKRTTRMVERIAEIRGLMPQNQKLADMFETCYVSTLETTTAVMPDGSSYVMTGDIPAMWLRDSTSQVRHYIPEAQDDPELARILAGLIQRQVDMVLLDNYANAFNENDNGEKWSEDRTDFDHPQIWERKYEVDSLCAVIHLAHDYWQATGDTSVFTDKVKQALSEIMDTFTREQYHFEQSSYFFERDVPPELVKTETLPNEGRGAPVGYTGMTWSGFRPSDDACEYGYLVPSNMYAVVALRDAAHILTDVYQDAAEAERATKLAAEIDQGIKDFAIVEKEGFGPIYAYETDGLGNYVFMDDANVPSLLAAPWLGYADETDEIVQNTRRFVLSKGNPFFYEGKYGKGVGSPHTPPEHIWPIALVIQGLTTSDFAEKKEILRTLLTTDADTSQMHESFHVDDPTTFTRSWFAWANSMFAQYILDLASTEEGRRILADA